MQKRSRLEMWLEKTRCGSNMMSILRTSESEMKVICAEYMARCIEGSGIFLMGSGKIEVE